MSRFGEGSQSRDLKTVEYQDENGDWRTEIVRSTTTFDERGKSIFLREFAKHARMFDAARLAMVSTGAVKNAINNDPQFAQAFYEAEASYRDRVVKHAQDLIFDGTTKRSYFKGELVSEETLYPIKLIQMELQKVDERYRDKREIAVNINSGVMVAPPEISIEEWEKKFGRQEIGDTIDAVVIDQDTKVESTKP